MAALGTASAVALAWLAGMGLCCALGRKPTAAHEWARTAGYGYVVGLLLATLALRLVDAVGVTLGIAPAAVPLVIVISAGAWRCRRAPDVDVTAAGSSDGWRRGWGSATWFVLVGLLAVRAHGMASDLVVRPLYAYDATTTWSAMARVWVGTGKIAPFVSPDAWLSATDRGAYTLPVWYYPATIPLVQVWAALGAGSWNETCVLSMWLGLWAALGLGFYGQARSWGVERLPSAVFTYFLCSIPMLNSHAVIAGYADLWLSAVFGMGFMSLLAWIDRREPGQGWMAVFLFAMLGLTKAEGWLWAGTCVLGWAATRFAARTLLRLTATAAFVLAVWWMLGGFSLDFPGLGTLTLTPTRIDVPFFAHIDLAYRDTSAAFVDGLLVGPSWHLLWYLAPLAVLASIPNIARCPTLLAGGISLACAAGVLFSIFFLSEASAFAESATAHLRLTMHVTAAVVFYLLLLFHAGLDSPRRH